MTIAKQLRAMAGVARAYGNRALAQELARVARWSITFKGWQTRPNIGPHAPSVALLHAAATHDALQFAGLQGGECFTAMHRAYRQN